MGTDSKHSKLLSQDGQELNSETALRWAVQFSHEELQLCTVCETGSLVLPFCLHILTSNEIMKWSNDHESHSQKGSLLCSSRFLEGLCLAFGQEGSGPVSFCICRLKAWDWTDCTEVSHSTIQFAFASQLVSIEKPAQGAWKLEPNQDACTCDAHGHHDCGNHADMCWFWRFFLKELLLRRAKSRLIQRFWLLDFVKACFAKHCE